MDEASNMIWLIRQFADWLIGGFADWLASGPAGWLFSTIECLKKRMGKSGRFGTSGTIVC